MNRELYGRRYVDRRQGIYWVRACEWQARGVIHYHALMAADTPLAHRLSSKNYEAFWAEKAGFAYIKTIDHRLESVTAYVTKTSAEPWKWGEIDISETLRAWQPHVQQSLKLSQ